jgi:thiol-disulfide isomerase/thioredoxin
MKLSGRVGRSAAELLSFEGRLPDFGGANGWLNSGPLSPDDLRGHVVLVNFWTFTCVNWLRTAPYIRALADKYKQQGLVTIGVHTPEFDVEHDFGNVERMVKDLRVDYPVAIDNDYAVWDAFTNNAWPAVYLADGEGALRYQHLGEGNYEESERAIQELLGVEDDLVSVEGSGLEAPADWENVRSPETYVGYARAEGFASPGGIAVGERHAYSLPEELGLNRWALSGEWTIGPQAAVLNEPGGRLTYRFHARDLNLVLAPPEDGGEIALRVLLDGEPPGEAHGEDIDEQGDGTVSEPRLYQLVRQSGRITDRTFEITFLERGAQAYVFTFG